MTDPEHSLEGGVENRSRHIGVFGEEHRYDVAGEREDGRLLRGLAEVGVVVCRRLGEYQARQSSEQGLSTKFLLDTEHRLRMKLPKREVVGLLQLEEFFNLPAHVVDPPDVRARELASTEAGKNDPRLLPPAGDPHEPPRSVDCAAAVQDNAVVVAAALLKDVDCLEGVALGHADNEVDASRKKLVEHLVGRVAAIQHEDITRFQMRQQRQQLNSFTGGTRRDPHRYGHLGDDIEQRANKSLRGMAAARLPEVREELGATSEVSAGPVDGEDPSTSPSAKLRVPTVEVFADHVQERAEQRWPKLLARQAEGRRTDRLCHGQAHACEPCLGPELIEQLGVTTPPRITAHVKQKRDEQLGCERPTAGEEVVTCEVLLRPRRTQQSLQERLEGRSEYGETGFCQLPACQRLIDSSRFSKKLRAYRAGAHPTANRDRFHPPARCRGYPR